MELDGCAKAPQDAGASPDVVSVRWNVILLEEKIKNLEEKHAELQEELTTMKKRVECLMDIQLEKSARKQ